MSTPSEITIAIATLGASAATVALPAPVRGLRYTVFMQDPVSPLPHSTRADVTYVALETLGLSHSRNSALAHCITPLLVFADDDMVLDTDGVKRLAVQMGQDSKLGFSAGWRAGRMPKTGRRAAPYRLRKLTAGRVCAPELMVRVEAVRAAGVQFDTAFGVGAQHPVGEDYIFVCDMLDAGLCGAAFPIVTGTHNGLSTGDNWSDTTILRARRTVLDRCFGAWSPMVRAAYALRHAKRLGGVRGAWRFWTGAIR